MSVNSSQKNSQKIPKLRFADFADEWKEKRLGDCLNYEQPTKYIVQSTEYNDSHGTPVLTAGKSFILGYTDEVDNIFINGLPVIIFDDFTTASKFVNFPFKVKSSAMKILKSKNDNNIKFVFETLQNIKYEVGGHGRHWISKYANIKILIPTVPEQQKIAEFLETVDKYIANLKAQKKFFLSYKKGMMQKIFSQAIRFKDDKGKDFPEWEEKPFLDIFQTVPTKNYQIKNSEILNFGKHKVVDQGMNLIAGYSNNGSKIFKDIPAIVFGDHTTILKYIDFQFVVGADGTKILSAKRKMDNLKFLYYLLSNNVVVPEGYKRHYSVLKNRKFILPSVLEQRKIASFLSSIDSLVEEKQKQIVQAEKWKKGLMQGLFV